MTLLVYENRRWVDTAQSRARGKVQLCVLSFGTGDTPEQPPEIRFGEGAFLLLYGFYLILEDVRVPVIHNLK